MQDDEKDFDNVNEVADGVSKVERSIAGTSLVVRSEPGRTSFNFFGTQSPTQFPVLYHRWNALLDAALNK